MKRLMILAASIFLFTAPGFAVETSWYGAECAGRLMANGKPFDPEAMTCASWDYPLGTKLRVSHGGRSVVVVVTDRGPARRLYAQGRTLDLSRAAFRKLGSLKAGLLEVNIERVNTR